MRPGALILWLIAAAVPQAAPAAPGIAMPALVDVAGVAADDTLNIRARPDPKAPVTGTLPYDARGIEAVAQQGGWTLVNAPGRTGWVNARYLRGRANVWTSGALPPTLSCGGTEPFWSLRQVGRRLVYETPGTSRVMERRSVLDAGSGPLRTVIAADDSGRMTAVIQPAQCSDAMSDRVYGLSAVLLFEADGQGSRMLSGCCRIAP